MAERDERGRFKPGHSGNNPAALTRSKLRSLATEEELDKVLRGIVDDALAGDQKAREWVGNRLVPQLKPQMDKAKFDIKTDSLESAASSILQAIGAGTVSADVGESLMRSLNVVSSVGQMAALSQRLADLEGRLSAQTRDVTPAVTQPVTQQQEPAHETAEPWRLALVSDASTDKSRGLDDDDSDDADAADAV